MRRSLAYCWPTSERALYSEPERLLSAGLATVTVDAAGPRPRRTYRITAAGRDALREWLGTPPAPMRISNEPLLRLLFADQAGPEELRASLEALRTAVVEQHRTGIEQMRPYLDGDGPFPDRAHLVTLFADLYARLFRAVEEWADDAIGEVSTWTSTAGLGLSDSVRARLTRIIEP
jgi:DNA-binding PadR family transcriptional regulator